MDFKLEVISLTSTAFWGLLWPLFYRKSELNIVENVVAAVFFVAQLNFFGIILQLALFPFAYSGWITKGLVETISFTMHLAYSFYFARRLFGEKLLWLIPKQIVLSLLFFLLVVIVFIGSFGASTVVDQLRHAK